MAYQGKNCDPIPIFIQDSLVVLNYQHAYGHGACTPYAVVARTRVHVCDNDVHNVCLNYQMHILVVVCMPVDKYDW